MSDKSAPSPADKATAGRKLALPPDESGITVKDKSIDEVAALITQAVNLQVKALSLEVETLRISRNIKDDLIDALERKLADSQAQVNLQVAATWASAMAQAAQCAEEQNTIGPNNNPRKPESVRSGIAESIRKLKCPMRSAARALQEHVAQQVNAEREIATQNIISTYEQTKAMMLAASAEREKKLREALAFYASPENYRDSEDVNAAIEDSGELARAAISVAAASSDEQKGETR